jgi:hypothetical protein
LDSDFRGAALVIPYLTDEAFDALDQADEWTQQEWCEWFDETHKEPEND